MGKLSKNPYAKDSALGKISIAPADFVGVISDTKTATEFFTSVSKFLGEDHEAISAAVSEWDTYVKAGSAIAIGACACPLLAIGLGALALAFKLKSKQKELGKEKHQDIISKIIINHLEDLNIAGGIAFHAEREDHREIFARLENISSKLSAQTIEAIAVQVPQELFDKLDRIETVVLETNEVVVRIEEIQLGELKTARHERDEALAEKFKLVGQVEYLKTELEDSRDALTTAKLEGATNTTYLQEQVKNLTSQLEIATAQLAKTFAEPSEADQDETVRQARELLAQQKPEEAFALFAEDEEREASRRVRYIDRRLKLIELQLESANSELALETWSKVASDASDEQKLVVAARLQAVADAGYHAGAYRASIPLAEEALRLRTEVLGEQHPSTLTSMNNLAALYDSQGRYSEAEPLKVCCLALRKEVLGERHPDTLTSMNNLAALYDSLGRYCEAEPLKVSCLVMQMEVLGERHSDTLRSMNNLAELYRAQGRYSEAEPLYVNSLFLCRNVLGDRHPYTLSSMSNLALLYDSQGRYSEAEPLYVDCLALKKEVLGERHPSTLTSMNNLAGLYQAQGRYSEAEPLYVDCLALEKEVLGERHPSTLGSEYNLAAFRYVCGQDQEAKEMFVEAEFLSRDLPETSPVRAGILSAMKHLNLTPWA